ncbi:transglycosylase SLT domain-containing protein [Pseudoxanthomonas daejeonensis]|uniref:Lytic murein transglycosylase n=1 Tax=Pseudoxanthomonas daejeonensis TaxID=266062 RepID=A0ABQ6ZB83_9GAMM|nr:transglycosylase SLT domain-containing protein [Pseudoxanthomonas daejeonensis]KAF1697358.1 lytic murein transglycosylase [Pseudoxanthomonas daejeonensis]UNK58502.1 transglycosylase SLT domain-containing protein [Pseudoxanthomonas daejeonensis]
MSPPATTLSLQYLHRSALALLLAVPSLALAQASASGADNDAAMKAAIGAAQRGQLAAGQAESLRNDPRRPWLEYAQLSRNLDTADAAQVRAFLQRYDGQASANALRPLWLASLSRRQQWNDFLADWRPSDDAALRCARLNAQQALGRTEADWNSDAQALWRSGKSLPDACDTTFATLAARGGLDDALRWERFDLAVAEGDPGVMRSAARGLAADALALAQDYAAFVQAPHARAAQWPRDARSRQVAAAGLAKLARNDPDGAERQLAQLAPVLGMDEAQRGQVQYQVALWTVASYLPDSARRLAAVPEPAYDERLHEWRAREAMARSDWKAALDAIRRMPTKQREDSRWRWFEGRMLEKTGRGAEAQALFRSAAASPTFHGFLAADRLKLPYALCPWDPADPPALRKEVARDPALVRALALQRIDQPGWAVREWNDALTRFDDARRRTAVALAQEQGWFDRAVFSLGKQPDEQRLYKLRFPLHHDADIRAAARRNDLDPAWIAAEIRAESTFNPNARSPANARGLMQLLPGTAAGVAQRTGLPYAGAESLYDSSTNIALGSAYLREMEDKYGQTYQAIAAYNAGPTPTARWLSQRPSHDPDLWIETISYKETRDYVARVLAFSAIYDWLLNKDALPVSERLLGHNAGARKRFACPTPALAI